MPQRFGGEWTEDKLQRLSRYLEQYTKVLKDKPKFRPFYKVYMDAFAGTGYREIWAPESTDEDLLPGLIAQEDERYAEGSARIALKVEPGFERYVFIEKDAEKCRELEKLRKGFPNKDVEICQGDANEVLRSVLNWFDPRSMRGVLFLDPFGLSVKWTTVEAIASTEAIDLWYLFDIGSVARMLPRGGQPPGAWRDKLNEVLGTEEWLEFFYPVKPSLFEEERVVQRDAEWREIVAFVQNRLSSVFPAVAPNPLVLRGPNGQPLYLLCFAIANRDERAQGIAVRIAKHILGMR
jgi:three-Cys-motif partner protein